MEFDIYYPYGIPYYLNEPFLTVHFVNNEESFVPIHFVMNKKKDKLAGLLIIFSIPPGLETAEPAKAIDFELLKELLVVI